MNKIKFGVIGCGHIGKRHATMVQQNDECELIAVCDAADKDTLGLEGLDVPFYNTPEEMLANEPGIDVVCICTPNGYHFRHASLCLDHHKHVLVEKPMALTTEHCDELMALAKASELLLVVYQNRRYDLDFLTMKKLVDAGEIGEVFHYESFVGGYSKPCSYWHSDADVSGGAIFDWGSHFIDQILAIVPSQVAHVSGLNQKRVWDHVTNADHAQVTINFADGVLATFVNSDLAAARKPKFFVLGTKGAIVGNWDTSAGDSVADLPAIITLNRADGSSQVIPLVTVEPFLFHASLAKFLADGTPMTVEATQSRDVVAIMQAAEESALKNGLPVTPSLLRS